VVAYAISVILASLFASSQLIFDLKNVGCLSLRFHFVVCLLNLLLLTIWRNIVSAVCVRLGFSLITRVLLPKTNLGWRQYYVV
jgi:hypothetical protein